MPLIFVSGMIIITIEGNLKMRKKIILICDECLSRNYETTRPEYAQERFTIKKYCPKCKRHTIHKESK